ncbi:MAG: ABC transporter permease [Betaproteobacteria bacterium]|nr:ABC transporter permease [Betaproteobacteria bacterium]
MRLAAVPSESWRAMALNPLRTGLTMLGMVIGVAAVVAMLAIGQGAQAVVNQQIASMGSNLFLILPGAATSGGMRMGIGTALPLTAADAQAIGELPTVTASAPMTSGTAQLIHASNNWSTLVYGITPEFWAARDWKIDSGEMFSETDVRSAARVALIGRVVAENLFGNADPVGETMRIRNIPFTVVGVLAPKGQSLDGRDQDDTVHVPLTTAQRRLFGMQIPGAIRFIIAQSASLETMDTTEEEIKRLLRQRRRIPPGGEDDFTVRNLTATAEAAAISARAMSFMLGAIASVSLLVGGIGIMNIMLVSVTERTREIGVRMAIGARRRDILVQFLTEALTICILGGAIGAALGVGGAWLAAELADMQVVVTVAAILLSFGFAAAVGLFFGFYPAHKAARLRPVEALRYE